MAKHSTSDDSKYRLSDDVIPLHYALTIKTDLDSNPPTFQGTAQINVLIKSETDTITFHAAQSLSVLNVVIESESLGNTPEPAKSISFDHKFERCTVVLSKPLPANTKATLGMVFKAELEGNMMGYYKASYAFEGKKGVYGLTQFEPTAARRAFPCWDEPAIKATFQVSLITRANTVALANTSPTSSEPSDGIFRASNLITNLEGLDTAASEDKAWVLTQFEPTPKVSTYLVAWANGPFHSKEGHYISPLTNRKVPLRVFATGEHVHQTQLLLDTTARILPVYEKIFDIPYPLSKLDTLVASDFDAGAMENWGLITCRTSVGLCDEASGIGARKRVVTTQSHEVAHQWFGNIVTMSWWQELWLNEAFATLMGELVVIEEIEPSWYASDDFINAHLSRALSLDSKRSSHAVEVPCPDPEMINQIFDAISYSKGASILKMLANFVGKEKFLKGVSLYLKAHLYGNGTTKDLWAGIAKATGKDIEKIMSNWTGKIGFPILTVEENADGLKITQNRFLSTGDPKPEEDETLWYVPLEIKTVGKDGSVQIQHDIMESQREVSVTLPKVKDIVYKLNADTCGVYRVRYPADRLKSLGAEIAKVDSVFTVADRMGLIQDAIELAQAGYSTTSTVLDFLKPLGSERNYLVWSEILTGTSAVAGILWEQDEKVVDSFDRFRLQLVEALAKDIGFEGSGPEETEDRIQLRVKILQAAAAAKDPKVLAEIKERFMQYTESKKASAIPADLRHMIFTFGVKYGGEKEYESVLAIYRKPSNPSEKLAAMYALCATTEEKLYQKTFDLILSGEVKEQDFMYFFAGLSGNKVTRRKIWEFVKSDYDDLMKRFKGNFSIGRLFQLSFSSFTTEEDAKMVEEFFKDKDCSIFHSALSQGLEKVNSQAKWLKRDLEDIKDWLKVNQF
ncbi:alanyl aminopeptidase [Melampsora americana]|nr:alanyl aminopeptidase [Melampsora americana]